MKRKIFRVLFTLVLTVSLILVPAVVSAVPNSILGQNLSTPVYDNVSQPIYDVIVEKNAFIPMRDGVNLAADIYRPDAEGEFPAILVYIPYGKDAAGNYGGQGTWFFAERGYVAVFCDLRGTGSSEGALPGYFTNQEWIDGYDVVEWIAAQPWCDGNVGMHGTSYGAITSTRVAALQPPHLKAIAVSSSFANLYGEHFFGGGARIAAPFVWISGPPNVSVTYIRPPLYDDPRYPSRLLDLWEYHLAYDGWRTFMKELWWDASLYDASWEESDLRSKYDQINIPVLQIGCLFDRSRDVDESFLNYIAFKKNGIPQKLIMGPWQHGTGGGNPYEFGVLTTRLAWFDYWLKGIDTGIMDGPPVIIFVTGENTYRYEEDWPIKRATPTKFYLTPGENLTPVIGQMRADIAKTGETSASFTYKPEVGVAAGPYGYDFAFRYIEDGYRVQMDQRRDELSLVFTTEVLKEDIEVTGMPEIVFYASSTADDTNFCVKLCDVLPDGKSEMVTRGWLNSSYRESNVNPRCLEDWHFVEPTKITPGEVYKYEQTLHNTAHVFKKGHRIRVDIASSDWPFIWPNPTPAVNEIHFDAKEGSYIVLPTVPEQPEPLPEPILPPPDRPVVPGKEYPKRISSAADCWIEESLLNNTISYNFKSSRYSWESASSRIWTEREWQILLPKDKPSEQLVTFTEIWIWERDDKDDLKYVIKYTCDIDGPQIDVETAIGEDLGYSIDHEGILVPSR